MIADSIGLMPGESELLQKRLLKGSSLFVSACFMDSHFLDTFNLELKSSFIYEKKVKFYFNSESVLFHSIFQNDTIYNEWHGYSNVVNGSTYPLTKLIRFERLSSLLKLELPNSTILIHTTPSTLCNVNVKSKNSFNYINFIINQLPNEQTIYFVDFARVKNTGYFYEDIEPENNLLQLIYENRILLNSMMLLFLTGILFVLFRTKRRREVIPVIGKEVNITKAFVETIASIYLNKQNPASLLSLQKKNFFDTIYRYYYIDLFKNKDKLTIISLAEKTNYDLNELSHLIKCLDYNEKEIGNDYIVQVAQLHYKFYKHCGIIEEKFDVKIHEFEVSRNAMISGFFLSFGFLLFTSGLYLLTKSNASGVLLWIIGCFLLIYGTLRFIRPHILIQKERITYYDMLGFPKTLSFDRIKDLSIQTSYIQLVINSKTIKIPLFDTLKIDISQLKRFIHLTKFYDN